MAAKRLRNILVKPTSRLAGPLYPHGRNVRSTSLKQPIALQHASVCTVKQCRFSRHVRPPLSWSTMLSISQLGNAIRSYSFLESVISPEVLLRDNLSGNSENALRKLHDIHFLAELGGIGISRVQFNDKVFNLSWTWLRHPARLRHR